MIMECQSQIWIDFMFIDFYVSSLKIVVYYEEMSGPLNQPGCDWK